MLWRAYRFREAWICEECSRSCLAGEAGLVGQIPVTDMPATTCSAECAGRFAKKMRTLWPELKVEPQARARDPGGSRGAARRVRGRAREHKQRILEAIRRHPGLEARQLADLTGIEAYTVRKRTADLRNEGRVCNQVAVRGNEELRWYPC